MSRPEDVVRVESTDRRSQTGTTSESLDDPLSTTENSTYSRTQAIEEYEEVPNEVDGVNTDGRAPLEWKSKYSSEAIKQIRIDAAYAAALFFLTLGGILLTWSGAAFDVLSMGCETCNAGTFNKYMYFFLGGMFGGSLFCIKYLYKVVARQFWHMDRRLWRIFSPLLSGGLALIVGALLDSGILGLSLGVSSGAAYLAYGFITGYFADRAIDKMQEVAETVFGAPGRDGD